MRQKNYSFTPTGVPFSDTNGGLSVDTTNFRWNKTLKQLNIGPAGVNEGFNNVKVNVNANLNDYVAIASQNLSGGDSASMESFLSNDIDGTDLLGHYITRGIFGSGYSPIAIGQIGYVTKNAGGTGYTVGDICTVTGGDGNATVRVLTLTGSAVNTFEVADNGTGYAVASAVATTGGTGSGFKINITSVLDSTAYAANDGFMYVSGGNLVMGTDESVAGKKIKFHTSGIGASFIRMDISDTAITAYKPFFPVQATTAAAPAYVKGGMYFDTTLNKLRIGGATAWETVTSV